jgi:hypothetical protein
MEHRTTTGKKKNKKRDGQESGMMRRWCSCVNLITRLWWRLRCAAESTPAHARIPSHVHSVRFLAKITIKQKQKKTTRFSRPYISKPMHLNVTTSSRVSAISVFCPDLWFILKISEANRPYKLGGRWMLFWVAGISFSNETPNSTVWLDFPGKGTRLLHPKKSLNMIAFHGTIL